MPTPVQHSSGEIFYILAWNSQQWRSPHFQIEHDSTCLNYIDCSLLAFVSYLLYVFFCSFYTLKVLPGNKYLLKLNNINTRKGVRCLKFTVKNQSDSTDGVLMFLLFFAQVDVYCYILDSFYYNVEWHF